MKELTKENFEGEVLKSDVPYMVDFWASWCGPCQMAAPIIEEVEKEYEGKLNVGKVNVDEQGELASEFAIVSIPTIIIFKNGKPAERIVGLRSFDDLCDITDKIL